MNKILSVVSVLVLLFVGQLFAESSRFAMGINLVDVFQKYDFANELESGQFTDIQYPVLYLSFKGPNIRIEPEFSFWRYFNERNSGTSNASTLNYSVFHLGLGLSPIINQTPKITTYIGVKLGLNKLHFETKSKDYYYSNYSSNSSRTDLFIGPHFGIEYLLTDNLSLGSEFQLMCTILGDVKNKNNQHTYNNLDDSGSFIKSNAQLFLKWHF